MAILAIRFSGLGDLVMLLPTLKELKKESEIILLTDSSNAKIQELSCGIIDEVWTIDREVFRQKRILKALKEIISLYKRLKKHRFEKVIDFHNFGETALITRLAKAPVKIGAPKPKYKKSYTHTVPKDNTIHRSKLFASIAGVKNPLEHPKLCVPTRGKEYAKRFEGSNIVGLNIGSTQESRRWSEEKFLELARRLRSTGHRPLIFIGPKERHLVGYFVEFDQVKGVDLVELAGAIERCKIFISNDTGPVHMAAALGVPTITLFSTGDDYEVGALAKKKRFIKKIPINDIDVDEVMDLFEELIKDEESQDSQDRAPDSARTSR